MGGHLRGTIPAPVLVSIFRTNNFCLMSGAVAAQMVVYMAEGLDEHDSQHVQSTFAARGDAALSGEAHKLSICCIPILAVVVEAVEVLGRRWSSTDHK